MRVNTCISKVHIIRMTKFSAARPRDEVRHLASLKKIVNMKLATYAGDAKNLKTKKEE